jgi:enterochelin esterase family protein
VLPLAALGLALASAPDAGPPSSAADTLQSPEVLSDRRVILRVRAPRGSEVTVAGEWSHPANTPEKLTRDAQGIWSITVGPLEPNIYFYVFNIDGVTVTDPINPLVKLRARTSASVVEIPGGQPWDARDVPHGRVEIHTHASAVLGGASRQVFVYTPPGYDRARGARYPVMYLFHGNNDLAAGWTMAGRAHLILDNFIADRKVVPMIVVMPWGHALPFGTKPPPGQPTNSELFERYLTKEVVPLVEGAYRIAPGRRQRAVVGLSMGGEQALRIGLLHRDQFATIGVFGSGLTRADFEARDFARGLEAGEKPALVFIGVGKEDGVRPKAQALAEALRAHGIAPIYREVEGGHIYPTWRKLLVELVPLVFRSRAPAGAAALSADRR